MNVVVFGCGRTGSTLALTLSTKGHQVTVIEQNPTALKRLGHSHTCETVVGSGVDYDVLERAGIQKADVFFALTRGDNTNLMSAQIAKLKYNVPKVCVKVADPMRADAYRKLGYECVNPSSLTAGLMSAWLLGDPFQPIDTYNTLPKELTV